MGIPAEEPPAQPGAASLRAAGAPRRLVLISQVFHPDAQATSRFLTQLLLELRDGRTHFTVVTAYTPGADGSFPPRREVLDGIEIRRTGIALDYKKSVGRRGLHYAFFLLGATRELWRLRRGALIAGVSNPPFTPVWLWTCRRIFRLRYQLLLHDIYPEGLVAVGTLPARGVIARLWERGNRRAFAAAGRIVVLGRDMADLLRSKYAVPAEKIEIIPHWSPFPAVEPIAPEKTRLLAALKLQGKFVVQYSGNMGLWHDIESIVRAADLLRHHPRFQFLLIGDGVRRAGAERLAGELSVPNISWLPFQPEADLPDSLASCHLALISQRYGLQGVAVPCKLYGILAAGRAVAAMVPPGSEIDLVVREENCGRVLAPGDADALVAAILELEADRTLLSVLGRNAFRASVGKYNLASASRQFRRIWDLPAGPRTA